MSLSIIVRSRSDLIVIEPSRRRGRCTLGEVNSVCTGREQLRSRQVGGHCVRSEEAEELAGIPGIYLHHEASIYEETVSRA